MLTRQYAKKLTQRDALTAESISLAQRVVDVLFVAGIRAQSWQVIGNHYRERLDRLVTMILELQKTIGEDIVASDFELRLVAGGQYFDPTVMKDGNGRAGHALPPGLKQRVLCTTALGLIRSETTTRKDQGKDSQRSSVVVLKPCVTLESMLKELAMENRQQAARERGDERVAGNRTERKAHGKTSIALVNPH